MLAGLIRYREALADMEPLVKKEVDPERRAQDTLLVARLKERIGDGVGAAAMLESSRADFRGQTKTELTVALAGILERSGRSAEAETLLRAELEGAQGEELVQLGGALAEVLNGLGRREEAVTLFSQLITKVGTGKAAEPLYWRQTLMAAAHKNWQQVLELLPRLEKTERPELAAAVEQLRATAEAGLGEIDRALAGLAAAKALSPLQVRAKRWEILQEAGRSGEFESELAALAASAKPEDQRFAAQMLQRFERYAEVVPVLEKLVAGEPEAQELQFGLAVAYERAGNHQKAVTLFEQLLAKDPNHAASLNYLGYMWAERRENLDQALAYILRAVALEPDNGAYVDSLGWAYFQVGRYQEAREQLEWAVRLVDDDATLHQHLGAVYGKLGQLDKAKEAYAQALELEKKAERQAEIQKELDALLRGAVPK